MAATAYTKAHGRKAAGRVQTRQLLELPEAGTDYRHRFTQWRIHSTFYKVCLHGNPRFCVTVLSQRGSPHRHRCAPRRVCVRPCDTQKPVEGQQATGKAPFLLPATAHTSTQQKAPARDTHPATKGDGEHGAGTAAGCLPSDRRRRPGRAPCGVLASEGRQRRGKGERETLRAMGLFSSRQQERRTRAKGPRPPTWYQLGQGPKSAERQPPHKKTLRP